MQHHAVDPYFDGMQYSLESTDLLTACKNECALICAIIHQHFDDLTSREDDVRRNAATWFKGRDFLLFCTDLGLNPDAILRKVRQEEQTGYAPRTYAAGKKVRHRRKIIRRRGWVQPPTPPMV